MDLGFSRLLPVADAALPAADMALLVAQLSSLAEASATAQVQAVLDRPGPNAEPLLAPPSGAFSVAMASRLAAWSNR